MTKGVIQPTGAFFLVAETARLLNIALRQQQEVSGIVKQIMSSDNRHPQTLEEVPTPTGGYEIHIVIHPPTAAQI
ncbi:MAG: hypothetical protein EXR98_06490 [Gemmataceae bacterium]|nr:hypothetical protein [Gemmataceae bacterium]